MYSVEGFGEMITDRERLDAYAEALRRTVTPSSVVVDLGAGTGILSLLACRYGARRVYAIEPSAGVHLLVDAARANGFADRVVVLQQRSTEVTLPERADVIVSDLRGVLPPYKSHFADLADARQRLLAPGGRLVPETDTMWIGVVAAPEAFELGHEVWQSDPHGLDLRSALSIVDNSAYKYYARADQLLSAPVPWARLHYPTLTEPKVRGAGTCAITKSGAAHGLLAWFDTELVPGVGYSNAPGPRGGLYGQMLFPWAQAESLREGDAVTFELRSDLVGAETIWTWTTEIRRREDRSTVARRSRQTSFKTLLFSPQALRKREATFAPSLSVRGELALRVLAGMRAGKTVGQLAGELHAAEPGSFPTLDEAHGFVAELSERYGV
jgi:protein arginine N-methyltransferase 1